MRLRDRSRTRIKLREIFQIHDGLTEQNELRGPNLDWTRIEREVPKKIAPAERLPEPIPRKIEQSGSP